MPVVSHSGSVQKARQSKRKWRQRCEHRALKHNWRILLKKIILSMTRLALIVTQNFLQLPSSSRTSLRNQANLRPSPRCRAKEIEAATVLVERPSFPQKPTLMKVSTMTSTTNPQASKPFEIFYICVSDRQNLKRN